jgi:hypothetical protein
MPSYEKLNFLFYNILMDLDDNHPTNKIMFIKNPTDEMCITAVSTDNLLIKNHKEIRSSVVEALYALYVLYTLYGLSGSRKLKEILENLEDYSIKIVSDET